MPSKQARREQPEPSELRHPLPMPIKCLMVVMTVWGIVYFFSVDYRPVAIGDHIQQSASADRPIDGQVLFNAQCAACHQSNGQGLPGVFPPLANSEWVLGRAAVTVQILLSGMTGPVEVLGQVYQGQMPAFGGALNDAEIAALATFIRTQWGNTASIVDTETVARLRADAPAEPWQADALLRSYPPL